MSQADACPYAHTCPYINAYACPVNVYASLIGRGVGGGGGSIRNKTRRNVYNCVHSVPKQGRPINVYL